MTMTRKQKTEEATPASVQSSEEIPSGVEEKPQEAPEKVQEPKKSKKTTGAKKAHKRTTPQAKEAESGKELTDQTASKKEKKPSSSRRKKAEGTSVAKKQKPEKEEKLDQTAEEMEELPESLLSAVEEAEEVLSRLKGKGKEGGIEEELPPEDAEPSPDELKELEEEVKEIDKQYMTGTLEVPRDETLPEEPVEEERATDSAIKLYLREIGKVPLLTPEQEIELAERIKKGDQEARELMIKANLRLVVKIAHDYDGLGLPLLDLISEGNIGLMKAVDRFDPKKGGKLSTYAAWWIKQSIKRALANQTRAIRLPVHLVDKISRMRRLAMKMQEALGREPTDDELAEELGTTALKVSQLKMAAVRPTSLESPIGDDDDSKTYAEVVKDERAEDPAEKLVEKTVTELLRRLLSKLDEREQKIIRYRFGLDGVEEKTLEELGKEMGVTRERIRQIQNQALAKLRKELEKLEKTPL